MKWIPIEKTPELSVQYLVYNPDAVIKCYTAFFLPFSTTEKAGFFHVGGIPEFGVTHYCSIPKPPKHDTKRK